MGVNFVQLTAYRAKSESCRLDRLVNVCLDAADVRPDLLFTVDWLHDSKGELTFGVKEEVRDSPWHIESVEQLLKVIWGKWDGSDSVEYSGEEADGGYLTEVEPIYFPIVINRDHHGTD